MLAPTEFKEKKKKRIFSGQFSPRRLEYKTWFFFLRLREAFYFNFITSDGIPSCIYCFVSKYKYDKLISVCGSAGVFGNNFSFGHTPERGQRPRTLISASTYPFGKSWYPYGEGFFFCFFSFLPLSTQRGVFFYPQPNFNLNSFLTGSTILRMLVLQY